MIIRLKDINIFYALESLRAYSCIKKKEKNPKKLDFILLPTNSSYFMIFIVITSILKSLIFFIKTGTYDDPFYWWYLLAGLKLNISI